MIRLLLNTIIVVKAYKSFMQEDEKVRIIKDYVGKKIMWEKDFK